MHLYFTNFLMCNSRVESSEHVFLCDVASNFWRLVAKWYDISFHTSVSIIEWLSWIDDRRLNTNKQERLEVVVIVIY